MKESKNLYQDNRITQARYEFSVVEKRLIYKIIEKIRNEHVVSTDGSKDLFGDLVVTLTDKDLRSTDSAMKQVYSAMRTLKTRFYEYDDDERWQLLGIVNEIDHRKKTGIWHVTVGKSMVEKFVEMAQKYTAYSLTVAMSLRSEHSQRFYEYCSQFKEAGGWQMSIEDLRYKMKMEDKYSRYAAFKKRVLDKAQEELKTFYDKGQCDLYFNYSEIKEGRSVKYLRFKVVCKTTSETALQLKDMDFMVRSQLNELFEAHKKPRNKLFIDKTMIVLRLDPKLMKHCYEKLQYVELNIPKQDHQKYMRWVIKDEYLNEMESDSKPLSEEKKQRITFERDQQEIVFND